MANTAVKSPSVLIPHTTPERFGMGGTGWSMAVSETSISPGTDLAYALASKSSAQPFWPKAVVALGVGLTVVWVVFIGYGFAKLIRLAM